VLNVRLLFALLLVAAGCQAPEELVVLPSLEGMSTLLVLHTAGDLAAYDLRVEVAPTMKWTPNDETDQLVLGLYRGTIDELLLEVDDGRVSLDPEGPAVPRPALAFIVSANAQLGTTPVDRWDVAPRVRGPGCATLRFEMGLGLPAVEASLAVPAPGGAGVLALMDDVVHLVRRDGSRIVAQAVTSMFEGRDGDVWLVEKDAIVRLDSRLDRVETLSTTVLTSTIVRGVEMASGPRFVFFGADLEYHSWDGVHAPRALAMPRRGRAPQYARILGRPDGALWTAEGGLFGEYSAAGAWTVSELAPIGSFSSLTETSAYGTLFAARTRSPTDVLTTHVFMRQDRAWEPLLPQDFLSQRVLVEHRGHLYGFNHASLVEVFPGKHERAASQCVAVNLTPPPAYLISTSLGLFAAGAPPGLSLAYTGWLSE